MKVCVLQFHVLYIALVTVILPLWFLFTCFLLYENHAYVRTLMHWIHILLEQKYTSA